MEKSTDIHIRYIVTGLIFLLIVMVLSLSVQSSDLDIFILGYTVFLSIYFCTILFFLVARPEDDLQCVSSKFSGSRYVSDVRLGDNDDDNIRPLDPSPRSNFCFDDVEVSASRLFDHWSQFHTSVQSTRGQRAFLVGFPSDPTVSKLKSIILTDGFDLDICSDIDTVTESIISSPDTWSLLVIDWDMLRRDLTAEEAVDILFYFRRFVNHIPMIIVSSEFSFDDFGTERIALSDVSVRSPVSPGRFKLAIKTACVNNEFFKQLQEGRLSKSSLDFNTVGDEGS